MIIESFRENDHLRVSVEGRLDSVSSGELESLLEREITDTTAGVTIDLGKTEFISSKGLRVLVAAYKKLDGREMTLLNTNASVKEVLRMSGLLKIFTLR